jgi:Mg2+ and Co2+ transporter CorA
MKEISTDESTSATLRLFAEISESKEVAISVYSEFLRDVANEIEQLEKKVSKHEHNHIRHRRLHYPWRNHSSILDNKAKMKDPDLVQRLLDAYNDMRTGSRNDLKDAADEILALREKLKEYENKNE